jgi:hypothetical protein
MTTPIEFNVYPNIKQSVTICKASITVQSYIIFKSATLMVSLYDTDDNYVCVKVYTLEGADFSNWGTDDSYIVNWVKSKLQNEG